MKIHRKLAVALTVLCILSGASEKLTAKAEETAGGTAAQTVTGTEGAAGSAEEAGPATEPAGKTDAEIKTEPPRDADTETKAEPPRDADTETKAEPPRDADTETKTEPPKDADTETKTEPPKDADTETKTEPPKDADTEAKTDPPKEPDTETKTDLEKNPEPETNLSDETETETEPEKDTEAELAAVQAGRAAGAAQAQDSNREPAFRAEIECSTQGWIVKGTFKDFAPDTILVWPLCSADGITYRECEEAWNLQWLGSEEEQMLEKLQNQRCLKSKEEPFKSYLDKDIDRFYVKLRIVREGGITYETQAAVIERGEQQPVPEEFETLAWFAPDMAVSEGRPPNRQYYGRYQITVSEDASVEEIMALLPDTLPVTVCVYEGYELIGEDQIDRPVKWKPLELPRLTAGGRVTVMDAAEEIVVPAGTVLNTQRGIYQTTEPTGMNRYDQYGATGEVRLVLNVVARESQPEAVLSEGNHGLEIAFPCKPTGAISIRAYTFLEGELQWQEISGLSLADMVNSQPSTGNSGYAVILGREQEPYRSYRIAREAGEEPTPFLVGLKIEGGVYDGKQIVLAWPDTYQKPPKLPEMGGSGGNVGNAGSDNKSDSTETGQRPGLSEEPGVNNPADGTAAGSSEIPQESGTTGGTAAGSPEAPQENKPKDGAATVLSGEPEEDKTPEMPEDKTEGLSAPEPVISVLQTEETLQAAAVFENDKHEDVDMEADLPESAQPGIQSTNERGTGNAGSRVLYAVAAGMTAALLGAGTAIIRWAGVGKIKDVLRRIFHSRIN